MKRSKFSLMASLTPFSPTYNNPTDSSLKSLVISVYPDASKSPESSLSPFIEMSNFKAWNEFHSTADSFDKDPSCSQSFNYFSPNLMQKATPLQILLS